MRSGALMVCPRCGVENPEIASFCKRCGLALQRETRQVVPTSYEGQGHGHTVQVVPMPLIDSQDKPTPLPSDVAPEPPDANVPTNDVRHRVRSKRFRLVSALIGCIAALIFVLVIAMFVRRPSTLNHFPSSAFVAMGQGITLHVDRAQFDQGGEGLATVTVSVPEDYDGDEIVVEDDAGYEIVSFAASDMQLSDGGRLSYSFDIDIPTGEIGPRTISARYGGQEKSDVPSEDEESSLTKQETTIYVSPVITYDDVLTCADVADDALSWAETKQSSVDDLVAWLESDSRVRSACAYETEVYFTTERGVLGSVRLEPVDPSYLGGSFESSSPAIEAFAQWEADGDYLQGQSLLWEDVCTNPDVLVLEPTPSLFAEKHVETYKEQAGRIATLTNGSSRVETGAQTLESLLRGDLVSAGTVLIHSHAVLVGDAAELSFIMGVGETSPGGAWPEARAGLEAELDALSSGVGQASVNQLGKTDPWQLFAGNALDCSTWRMSVVAAAVKETATHIEGVRVTSSMISWWYQDSPFDNSLLYVGSCYGLADSDFTGWVLSNGAQALIGYAGRESAEADARNLTHIVNALSVIPGGEWRTQTIKEASEVRLGLGAWMGWKMDNLREPGSFDMPCFAGNEDFFLRGEVAIRGSIVMDIGDELSETSSISVELLAVRAYLARGTGFELQGETKVASDGTFSFDELPAGDYVFQVVSGEDVLRLSDGAIAFYIRGDSAEVDGGEVIISEEAPATSSELPVADPLLELGVMNSDYVVHDERLYFSWEHVYHGVDAPHRIVSCKLDGSDSRIEYEGGQYLWDLYDAGDHLLLSGGYPGPLVELYSFDYASSELMSIADADGLLSIPFVHDDQVYFTCYEYDMGGGESSDYRLYSCEPDGSAMTSLFDLGSYGISPLNAESVMAVAGGAALINSYEDYGDYSAWTYCSYAVPISGAGEVTELPIPQSRACVVNNRIITIDGDGVMWSSALDGSDPTVLASYEVTMYAHPSIKNANSQFIYVNTGDAGVYLDRYDLQTGEHLTMNAEDGMWGAFDIIGNSIYYFRGYDEIMRCDLDGSNRTVVFKAQ